ncbi:MAG: VOC family protein [Bacteroidia bacterium]|nr:VOC family protein [Bacteroidia bacterium]
MNTINWFEIPVMGFRRAREFYEGVLGITITEQRIGGAVMGFLGDPAEGVTGAIVKHEWYQPSENGVLIYLNAGDDLSPALTRAEALGATVLVPKTRISDTAGYMAVFRDPEGNRIALRSPH